MTDEQFQAVLALYHHYYEAFVTLDMNIINKFYERLFG